MFYFFIFFKILNLWLILQLFIPLHVITENMQTNLPGPGPVRPTERGESGGRNTCVDYIVHPHKRLTKYIINSHSNLILSPGPEQSDLAKVGMWIRVLYM